MTYHRCIFLNPNWLAWILLFISSLSGCQAAEEGKRPDTETYEVESMLLTIEDSGRDIVAHPGDRIEVRLNENPTTGYRWAQESLNEAIIKSIGSDYEMPEDPLVGQGGIRSFQYQAAGVGETVIALKYWQEWEGESSVTERFTISVTVIK